MDGHSQTLDTARGEVAYSRPGFAGIFNVAGGKRRELDGPGPAGANGWSLVAGVVYWLDGNGAVQTEANR